MQQNVHAAYPQHRAIEVKGVKQFAVKMLSQFVVAKDLRMVVTQVFTNRY